MKVLVNATTRGEFRYVCLDCYASTVPLTEGIHACLCTGELKLMDTARRPTIYINYVYRHHLPRPLESYVREIVL